MATSYANTYGTGDRRTQIFSSLDGGGHGSIRHVYWMLDGSQADNGSWGGATDTVVLFWFNNKQIIDEAKWYQDSGSTHGTFKWQGSDDNVTWTDIGSTFTLGGTTQTQTQLNGNTTAYRMYRLFQTAGTTSGAPWLREIEFKIEDGGQTTSYGHAQGKGDRTSSNVVTVTESGTGLSGTISKLVNGAATLDVSWGTSDITNDWMKFDFGAGRVMTQARWMQNGSNTHGTWKWQGSNDNSSWTDIGSSFTLGANAIRSIFPTSSSVDVDVSPMGDIASNTTAYRYYRILGVSGAANGTPWLVEVEFELSDAPATPVTGGNISSGSTLFPPSVGRQNEVVGATIASGSSLNAPTVNAGGITLPFISPTTTLTGPYIGAVGTQTIGGAHIASGLHVYAPFVELSWPSEPTDTFDAYRDINRATVGIIWVEAFLPD